MARTAACDNILKVEGIFNNYINYITPTVVSASAVAVGLIMY